MTLSPSFLRPAGLLALLAFGLGAPQAWSENLFQASSFSQMASDRRAAGLGDTLTVIINETSAASNSNRTSTAKANGFLGQITLGNALSRSIQLGGSNSFTGNGEINHAGKMVAQFSVLVDEVLPNGDLSISGSQSLNINGEKTHIRLSGRVRPADISSTNSVLSSNLADAVIEYQGRGFTTNAAKPGLVTRVFNWLGLI